MALLEVGGGRGGVAQQRLGDYGIGVDCVVQGLADALVRELGAVEHQEQQAEGLDGFNLNLGGQLVHVQVGHVLDGLGAGRNRGNAGGRVGQQQPGHVRDPCRVLAVVVIELLEDDAVFLHGRDQAVGAGTDGLQVEAGGICRDDGLRHNLDDGDARTEAGEGVLELELHG